MGKSVSGGGRGPDPARGSSPERTQPLRTEHPPGRVPPLERDPRLERALRRVRGRIDRLDRRIISLLERRRGEVVEAGRIKRLLGLPVADPRREEEIVTRIRGYVRGAEGGDYIEDVYRAIFRCSRAVEEEE